MALETIGAIVGTYVARNWWQGLLLALLGALVGRICLEVFLYMQYGLTRESTEYVDRFVGGAIKGVLTFPSYFSSSGDDYLKRMPPLNQRSLGSGLNIVSSAL